MMQQYYNHTNNVIRRLSTNNALVINKIKYDSNGKFKNVTDNLANHSFRRNNNNCNNDNNNSSNSEEEVDNSYKPNTHKKGNSNKNLPKKGASNKQIKSLKELGTTHNNKKKNQEKSI